MPGPRQIPFIPALGGDARKRTYAGNTGAHFSPRFRGEERTMRPWDVASEDAAAHAAPSRSASVLVSPSLGRLCHALVPSSGANEGRGFMRLPAAPAPAD